MNQEKMQQLQAVEQSLQSCEVQKQQVHSQLAEIESAKSQLDGDEAYRIVGNIMVKADPKTLRDELTEKEISVKNRLDIVVKQETRLRDEAKALQESVMQALGEKNE